MASISELCKRRSIAKYDVETPLLVPSFSSKGFTGLQEIWDSVHAFLPESALISSYDLYYNHFSTLEGCPSLLFVDSGGYEARKDFDLSEIYTQEYFPKSWSEQNYHEALKRCPETFSNRVLISYDELVARLPFAEQVDRARNFFSQYPETATDFLAKPSGTEFFDSDELIANIKLLQSFDILGLTEKELGNSIQERVRNVIRIRLALNQNGLEIPIHIFGCLDPLSIWLYYFCGADIFDGLTWLRLVFVEDMAVYRNNWAIWQNSIEIGGRDLEIVSWLENLRYLRRQRLEMIKFAHSHNAKEISIDSGILNQVIKLIVLTESQEGV